MKDEIEQNSGDSSRILYDITLNLADSTGVDDGFFPDEFSVNFTSFGDVFEATFVKLSQNDPSYPTSSRDIYVIDPPTGQPRRRHTHKQNSV